MKKFRISYTIAGRDIRRDIVIELASGEASTRSIARAILKHEFAEVEAPFGAYEALTAEQALERFAVADVRTSIVTDD